jgi:cysteine-rich repeat protein
MTSVCGDGWKDEAMGETCDDGNAIASGGCSADCKTVSAGYTCGERADKCALAPSDEEPTPEPSPEAAEPSPELSEPNPESNDDPEAEGGGCAGGSLPALGSLLLLVALRRR